MSKNSLPMTAAETKIHLLLVCPDQPEGNLMRLSLEELFGDQLNKFSVVKGGEQALTYFKANHPDVLVLQGIASGHAEAIALETRKSDGNRHTGIVLIHMKNENYDAVSLVNLSAGVDAVLPPGTNLAVVKLHILSILNQKRESDSLRTAMFKYQNMNLVDELTGLANMRGFIAKFGKSYEKCLAGSTGVAVVMMDLDHFKKVNDSTNHMVGSFVIKSVGHLIAKLLGQQLGGQGSAVVEANNDDFAARFGGDEYIIVLHGMDEMDLLNKTEELRQIIQNHDFKFQGFSIKITCSQGLCWIPPKFEGNATDVVKCADAMLYKVKAKGRNAIIGMRLSYPIDFNHIGGAHMIDWDAGSNDNRVPRRN